MQWVGACLTELAVLCSTASVNESRNVLQSLRFNAQLRNYFVQPYVLWLRHQLKESPPVGCKGLKAYAFGGPACTQGTELQLL